MLACRHAAASVLCPQDGVPCVCWYLSHMRTCGASCVPVILLCLCVGVQVTRGFVKASMAAQQRAYLDRIAQVPHMPTAAAVKGQAVGAYDLGE